MKDKINDIHIIFFNGIDTQYRSTQMHIEGLCMYLQNLVIQVQDSKLKVIGHAHKYSSAFYHYVGYAIASFLLIIASILVPIILLINVMKPIIILSASLAFLACIFLSILLLTIPFINHKRGLFKSSIEKIDELIMSGVEPSNIILLGYCFGGVAASEILKHFLEQNIQFGGVVFVNTFSSFEQAVINCIYPQTKILNVLPLSCLRKLFKAVGLDFNLANDVYMVSNKEKFNSHIVVINHALDNILPQSAQLAYVLENSLYTNLISIIYKKDFQPDHDFKYNSYNKYYSHNNYHRCTLYSKEVNNELTDIILSNVKNARKL